MAVLLKKGPVAAHGPQLWKQAAEDVHVPISAPSMAWMRGEWLFAGFLVFIGTLMLRNPPDNGNTPFAVTMIAGAITTAAGLYLLLRPWLSASGVRKTLIDIDERGVFFNLRKDQAPVHIPWSEVRGVERKSFVRSVGKWIAIFISEPCLVVSKDFYARCIHIDSLLQRGPTWHLTFVADDKNGVVRIVLNHRWFGWPKRHLFAAVVARRRAFGPPPTPQAQELADRHAAAGPLDRFDEARTGFMAAPGVRIAVKLIVAGILVWLWLKADHLLAPRFLSYFDERQAGHFAKMLLDEGKMPARLSGGRMMLIGKSDLSEMTARGCKKERIRNPAATNRKTRYQDRNTCFMDLRLKDGTPATGVFHVLQTYRDVELGPGQSFQESRDEARTIDLPEAQALVCAEVNCE